MVIWDSRKDDKRRVTVILSSFLRGRGQGSERVGGRTSAAGLCQTGGSERSLLLACEPGFMLVVYVTIVIVGIDRTCI